MLFKVPYTNIGGYRPYLAVVFFNEALLKKSSSTFGVVDSGADITVIPFSLGRALGLQEPTPEEYKAARGIGGNLSLIERKCRVYILGGDQKQLFGFDTDINWAYPEETAQDEMVNIFNEYKNLEITQEEAIKGTNLWKYFETEKAKRDEKIKTMLSKYETDVLIGRSLFHNFEFVQFVHKDREPQQKGYFVYKIRREKVAHILDVKTGESVSKDSLPTGKPSTIRTKPKVEKDP